MCVVLEWNVFEDGVCSIGFDLYSSQYQHGGEVLCQGQLCNWHVRLLVRVNAIACMGSCPSCRLYTLSVLNVPLFILGPFLPQIVSHSASKEN